MFFPFLFFFFGRKAAQKVGGVFQQLWETTAEQHQRGEISFWDLLPK